MNRIIILFLIWHVVKVTRYENQAGMYRVEYRSIWGQKRTIITDDSTININKI